MNRARPASWLLDLTVGGRPFRFSSEQTEVSTASGGSLLYEAGLGAVEISYADGGQPFAVQLAGAASSVSWAALVRNGADLEAGTATLRRWYAGEVLEAAEVVATGRITGPEFGAIDEPITFSIDLPRYERTITVPGYTERIDETTWPVTTSPFALLVDVEQFGAVYPRIYGRPGSAASFLWGTLPLDSPASPAYMAEFGGGAHTYNDSKLIIAGHRVAATTVRLVNASAGLSRGRNNTQTFTVETMQDLRGQTVSFIRRSGATPEYGSTLWIPGGEYWVAWSEGGGVVDPETGGEMRRLGRVLIDLLSAGGVPVDYGRAQAARGRLDQYLVDAVISEPARPEDWIGSNVGSVLPLLRRETPAGVWYELWRYDATLADVSRHLVGDPPDEQTGAGIPVVQTSRFEYTDLSDVENDVTLRYLVTRGYYHRSARISGSEQGSTTSAARNEFPSALAAASLSRYGRRTREVRADWIADDATAELALQMRARWLAFARRRFTVEGGAECFDLRPNDVVTYTRSAVGLSDALALVLDVRLGLDTVAIDLELLERPTQRGRA